MRCSTGRLLVGLAFCEAYVHNTRKRYISYLSGKVLLLRNFQFYLSNLNVFTKNKISKTVWRESLLIELGKRHALNISEIWRKNRELTMATEWGVGPVNSLHLRTCSTIILTTNYFRQIRCNNTKLSYLGSQHPLLLYCLARWLLFVSVAMTTCVNSCVRLRTKRGASISCDQTITGHPTSMDLSVCERVRNCNRPQPISYRFNFKK